MEPPKNANVAAELLVPQPEPDTLGALALEVRSMEYPYQSTTKSLNWDPDGAEASYVNEPDGAGLPEVVVKLTV